jgi:hypothetical protein
MARRKHTRPRCRPNSDTATFRTTLDIYTQITDPEVARMVNQVTNRILGLVRRLSRAQFSDGGEIRSHQLP